MFWVLLLFTKLFFHRTFSLYLFSFYYNLKLMFPNFGCCFAVLFFSFFSTLYAALCKNWYVCDFAATIFLFSSPFSDYFFWCNLFDRIHNILYSFVDVIWLNVESRDHTIKTGMEQQEKLNIFCICCVFMFVEWSFCHILYTCT